MIRVENVTYSYGGTSVLGDLSFTKIIRDNESYMCFIIAPFSELTAMADRQEFGNSVK